MTTFPGSPRLVKGAIVGIDPVVPVPTVVLFQYNPDTLSRTLRVNAASGAVDMGEALRLKGPPQETLRVEIEIDAADQLEKAEFPAVGLGVYPALSALEMLLYPRSASVIQNEFLAQAGMIEIIPPQAPLTLFAWGSKRVLPVRITELSITEEAFDPALNPLRAKIALGLRVLTYNDLGLAHPGGALFLAHQIIKETMSLIGTAANLPALPSLGGG